MANNLLFLEALVAGLSAPSLRDVDIHNYAGIWPPMVVHIPRFLNEIEEHYHVVHVVIQTWGIDLSLLAQPGCIRHWKPGFKFGTILIHPPESIIRLSAAISTTLATVEELHVTFEGASTDVWEDLIPWRRFLQQLPSVKVLRAEGKNSYCIARILLQGHEDPDDDVAFLPALEEIELEEIQENPSPTNESQCEPELAALDAFIFARQQAGCPVEAFFSNQLDLSLTNEFPLVLSKQTRKHASSCGSSRGNWGIHRFWRSRGVSSDSSLATGQRPLLFNLFISRWRCGACTSMTFLIRYELMRLRLICSSNSLFTVTHWTDSSC
jgi:hypothetical protein